MKLLLLFAPILVCIASFGEATSTESAASQRTEYQAPELQAIRGAERLGVDAQSCASPSLGTMTAHFLWGTSGQGLQWLDLSLSDNGFVEGTYVTVGPMDAAERSFYWAGLLPGRSHYARINTLTVSGWYASPTVSFVTSDCLTQVPAQALTVSQLCKGASITAEFTWLAGTPPGEQWLDLSIHDNGFAPGTFLAAGPFSTALVPADNPGGPNLQAFFWEGLVPGQAHYWRVNTWTGASWITSATGRFFTFLVSANANGSSCYVVVPGGGP